MRDVSDLPLFQRVFEERPARTRAKRELAFEGETFEPARDGARLSRQLHAVFAVMQDGQWHTLEELAERCGGTVASVSARVRDLRKARFGGHEVERECVGRGLWRYRLRPW